MNRKRLIIIGGASIAVIVIAVVVGVAVFLANSSDDDSQPREAFFYRAGVVEYERIRNDNETQEALENLENYLKLLEAEEVRDLDIFVFPESTLNNLGSAVLAPESSEQVNVCTDESQPWDPILRKIACAARDKKLYVVINVSERSVCPDVQQLRLRDPRPCAESGVNLYNTNLVFDRNGVLVSKYRKFNLFGEPGKLAPYEPESVSFDTDFGVTFGHFVCFDLLFEKPAMDLVRRGIRDYVFPTMWFSEIPFLSAVQIQQGWAFANNVNFLAAGASRPEDGSTGSGIYHGREGILTAIMTPEPRTQILTASVPRIGSNARLTRTPVERFSPAELQDLQLWPDKLDPYTSESLVFGNRISTRICHGERGFCCTFDVLSEIIEIPQDERKYYKYRLAAFQGVRTFNGFADAGVKTCAVMACIDETLEGCQQRFPKGTEVVNALKFLSINITTSFNPRDNEIVLPSTLDSSVTPLGSEYVEFREKSLSPTQTEITMSLLQKVSDLFTFAVYGRDFSLDVKTP